VRRKLILSPEAAGELEALTEFIATDSLDAALRFQEAAQNAFQG
jgi:plasmid stabilization system protein ParE